MRIRPRDLDHPRLGETEAETLWEQYSEAYESAQSSFDSSVRNLAGVGIALCAALTAGFDQTDELLGVAAILFAVALVINLGSHWTERIDVEKRLRAVERYEREGSSGNALTTVTGWLNNFAGFSVIAGMVVLAVFVSTEVFS